MTEFDVKHEKEQAAPQAKHLKHRMQAHSHATRCGDIRYWVDKVDPESVTLVFLPGLTADHRLFVRQIEYFLGRYNLFVWDAPGHASSWPFSFDFDLEDKARWLDEIFLAEGIKKPILVGQSMGGYVAQMYSQLFPEKIYGFVSIDSAPLQRKYVTAAEIWLLERMEPVYAHYPWKALLASGSKGTATTSYGRHLMRVMMMTYDGDQARYAKLAGHGYAMLADAMKRDLPYEITCEAILICGEQDHAGSCIRYNKAWAEQTGLPIYWIGGAGHNSNTDRPETVNGLIQGLVNRVEEHIQ